MTGGARESILEMVEVEMETRELIDWLKKITEDGTVTDVDEDEVIIKEIIKRLRERDELRMLGRSRTPAITSSE